MLRKKSDSLIEHNKSDFILLNMSSANIHFDNLLYFDYGKAKKNEKRNFMFRVWVCVSTNWTSERIRAIGATVAKHFYNVSRYYNQSFFFVWFVWVFVCAKESWEEKKNKLEWEVKFVWVWTERTHKKKKRIETGLLCKLKL